MNKKFKIIKEFPNYSISRSGIVINNKTWRTLTPDANRSGYFMIRFYSNKKIIARYVARLVAVTYIPNPENKPEVNHKDGNKHNNWDWNLEWVTRSENKIHAFRLGLCNNTACREAHQKAVNVYDYITEKFLSVHVSLKDAAFMYSVHSANVSKVVRNIRKHTGGFIFKLV